MIQRIEFVHSHKLALKETAPNDSSNYVCIEDCYNRDGDDLIFIKSGWDQYGISYARPCTSIIILRLTEETTTCADVALGSKMSGGISEVHVVGLRLSNSRTGIGLKTAPGRGGYVQNIYISDVIMENVKTAIRFTSHYGGHAHDQYDPDALPTINKITFEDVTGTDIQLPGFLDGIEGDTFLNICLHNITLSVKSDPPWNCSNVQSYSNFVSPKRCGPSDKEFWKILPFVIHLIS